jgi:hypothetical protein
MKKFALLVIEKDGDHCWSDFESEAHAEDEASIYSRNGAQVVGVFPYEEKPRPIKDLQLEGHDEKKPFAYVMTKQEVGHEIVPEDCVVGAIGGYESTLHNFRQIKEWLDNALKYLTT